MTDDGSGPSYAHDLAYIHDVGFGDFARAAAPQLLSLLARNGIEKGLVADLGCGSGIWARCLTEAGFEVLGIDSSAAMIDLARNRAPQAEFRIESLFRAQLPPCSAVTSLGECLSYRFDSDDEDRLLSDLFGRTYRALRPGGVLIFDALEPGSLPGGYQQRFREGQDWTVLVEAREDAEASTLSRRIVTFRRQADGYRRSEETHRLRLIPAKVMAQFLRDAGFRVRLVRGYGKLRFRPSLAGFIARKPG